MHRQIVGTLLKKSDQIRNILHVDRSSIAKTIRPLLSEGYIRREVNPEDKRAYKIFLTEKGRAIDL